MQIILDTDKMDEREANRAIQLIASFFDIDLESVPFVFNSAKSVTINTTTMSDYLHADELKEVPQPVVTPVNDVAAIFSAQPAVIPGNATPALPTAVAGQSPTAPVVVQAGSPATIPAAPQPVATAPAQPAVHSAPATPPTPAGGVELDAEGLPWDARIHSLSTDGGHPKTTKGVWKARKGVNDPALVARVKAELIALMAIPAGSGTTAIPPAPAAAPAAPVEVAAAIPTPPNMPQPLGQAPAVLPASVVQPAVPIPPAPATTVPPAAGGAAPTSFETLMPLITKGTTAGLLPQTALLDAVKAYKMENIPALLSRPDLVPDVFNLIKASYPAFAETV